MSQHPIVALGASAGGLQAFKEFFEHTPPDTGAAFVAILHLSPSHDSQLAQILQHATKMPVAQVKEKTRIRPNHVYVIPPDMHLTMEAGYIMPTRNVLMEERRAPVDIFFRSIAEVHGARAVGVVLSGTGANGSMGLKRIKEQGGAVFVQDPKEAEFNEMLRHAIATDLVDAVLNVAELPGRILTYVRSLGAVQIPEDAGARDEAEQQALREIFSALRLRTGHDFSNYKRATLMRRIERRISLRALPDLASYARYMSAQPEETHALLKDLLISVTNFFRDRKPWEELEATVLPQLFEDRSAEEQVRIWVAGCATGEEAYTIAMLCAERTLGQVDAPKVQVFATDIDETAISTAREGYYTLNDAADISPERLSRFFIKEGDGYRVRHEIREMVLFATHNFLKDPPFSRLDLVTCRNVLIYLNRAAQERVMETFHFALKPGCFMLLGTSENVDGASDLYKVVNRDQHIFQTKLVAAKSIVVPEPGNSLRFDAALAQPQRLARKTVNERITYSELHLRLLESYAPPSLVVNAEFELVHLSAKAGRYMQVVGGEPTQNILKLIRDELRLELRSALYQAQQKDTPVTAAAQRLRTDEAVEDIIIQVRPVNSGDEIAKGYLLVVFEQAGVAVSKEATVHTSDEPAGKHLEEELTRLRIQLRASNEQHEFHAEELKASNEELQAMNEELRSASEELETSKEELQSINEELSTVNQELKVKVEEASLVSSNLQNLINSTDIGTIFLDRSFRVVLFTPAARSVFNLISADFGRPLSDITSRLPDDILLQDAEAVLQRLNSIEREVETTDGRTLLMRLSPYRTEEDRIQGVVISFVDITDRKRAEEIIRASEARLQRMVNVPRVGVITFDYAGALLHANDAFLKMTGYDSREEFEKRRFTWRDFTPEEYVGASEEAMRQLLDGGHSEPYEKEYFRKDGSRVWMMFVATNMGDGTIVEYALDISDRVAATAAMRESEERLRVTAQTAMDYAIINTDAGGIVEGWSRGAERMFGWTEAEAVGQPADIIFTPEDRAAGAPQAEMETAVREGHAPDERWHMRKDGSRFFVSGVIRPIAKDGLRGFVKVARDLTERQQAEERLRIALQSAEMGAWDWNVATDESVWNEQLYQLLGAPPDQVLQGNGFFFSFVHPEDVERAKEDLYQAVEETGMYQSEFRVVRGDTGKVCWMAAYGHSVAKDNKGRSTRMVGVIYDITRRKHVEEQKEEFIGIASHELKTPLTSIKAYAEVLLEMFEEAGDAPSATLMQRMDGQIDRLNALISTLLDATRIREGRLLLVRKTFDLVPFMELMVGDLQPTTDRRLVLTAPESVMVYADQGRLGQVVGNLLSNAIKYAQGNTPVEVTVSVEEAGVQVCVRDYGIGMSEGVKARVFERFYRAEGEASATYPGLGLGLYIAAEIVRLHGGAIWVESTPGEGSTFCFTLGLDAEPVAPNTK